MVCAKSTYLSRIFNDCDASRKLYVESTTTHDGLGEAQGESNCLLFANLDGLGCACKDNLVLRVDNLRRNVLLAIDNVLTGNGNLCIAQNQLLRTRIVGCNVDLESEDIAFASSNRCG